MKQKLLRAIEQHTGLQMQHNRDFTELSDMIFKLLHESISASTLKRIWGYVDSGQVKPRAATFNILASLIGFHDYEYFVKMNQDNVVFGGGKINEAECSNFCFAPYWEANKMAEGGELIARWAPNRCMRIKHLKGMLFEVIEADNCKLNVGDIFCCEMFINGESLRVFNLTHNGVEKLVYVAGMENGGVRYEEVK